MRCCSWLAMAGEIEDCLSFQADSLPTGSISFGRFEVESLSWERRSSFSHNRYLEEVEKYSTPGSVTQKKAYFEAHFKKKALLRQSSSVSHNGVDWQPTENGIEDHVYMEEYIDDCNTGHHQFAWNDETSAVSNELEHDIMERDGGQLQFSWYDETPPAISDEDEYEVIESNEGQLQFQYDEARALSDEHQHDVIDCKQGIRNSVSELPVIEPMPCNSMNVLNYPIELVDIDEVLQTRSIDDNMQSDKGNSQVVEQETENGSLDVGEIREKCDFSSKKSMVEHDNSPSSKKTQGGSCNVTAAVEQKPLKAKLRTILPVAQTTRKTSTEKNSLSSVKAFTRTLRETERVNMLRTKTERESFLKVPPSTFSVSKNFKRKDSENLKAQARQGTRSGKGLGANTDGVCPQSISGKGGSSVCQSADRPKKVVYSTRTNLKQSNATFKFRSDERAEKRKEFVIRLEEKFHAKEVQMNEIQARTQVQTEAELKQLRRNLNFKATPMPSFYHEAEPRDSDGKKTVVTRAKSPKPPTKSPSPGSRAAVRTNSTEKAVNREGPALGEPVGSNPVGRHAAAGGGAGCASKPDESRDIINRVLRSAKRIGAGSREEREKHAVQQQQQQQRGERKAKKGERVGVDRRDGVGKVMKGIVGRGLAVHVAS